MFVTFLSDFGLQDDFVGTCHGVIKSLAPDVDIIDITHGIDPQHVLQGALALRRALPYFPAGVHLAVVDPGVGTDRRILVARINQQTIVCPDNGLITWAWRRLGPGQAYELTWRPPKSSNTFHGRDIMAPAAGMLAAGRELAELARPIDDPVLLDVSPVAALPATAKIIHIDQFGNATTNLSHDVLQAATVHAIRVKGLTLGRVRRTYWDVAPGKPLALIGSSGLLEIAVRDGSAADDLKLQVGDEVVVG